MTNRELVSAIIEAVERQGYPPSVRELADLFDRSVSTIHDRLHKLADAGVVSIEKGRQRAIRVERMPE